jgi:hypothetical protein
VGLTYVTGRWTLSPLEVRATLVAGSSEWFTSLSTPHTIPGVFHKWLSLHLLVGINIRVLGVSSLTLVLHNLL